MMFSTLWHVVMPFALAAAMSPPPSGVERAQQLKDFIQKEKPKFEEREARRRDMSEELDRLNLEQNKVRSRIGNIGLGQQELNMALDNLAMEVTKQRELELQQKRRLLMLLKVAYRIKKDGILRFLMHGESVATLSGRVRVLYHTLRSHTQLTRQLEERANRLAASEKKLASAKDDIQRLLAELKEQEELLGGLLEKKHKILQALNQKQRHYNVAMKEYRVVSAQLANLFDNFESQRDAEGTFPGRRSLPLPIEFGKIVKNFGKSVHEKFHTVTYQKGVEIEADYNTPVTAIMPGVVEYDGWVKGLGNVLILHHGGGFYSLCAHLFKSLKPRGTHVAQGEAIALVGDTGSSEKPSLYFEIRENGKAVDPLSYFSPQAMANLH